MLNPGEQAVNGSHSSAAAPRPRTEIALGTTEYSIGLPGEITLRAAHFIPRRFATDLSHSERIRRSLCCPSVSTAHRLPRIQILTGSMLTRLAAVEMFVRSTTHQKVASGEARRRQGRLEEVAMNEMLNPPLTGAPSDA
jgi:hypothetical protein